MMGCSKGILLTEYFDKIIGIYIFLSHYVLKEHWQVILDF